MALEACRAPQRTRESTIHRSQSGSSQTEIREWAGVTQQCLGITADDSLPDGGGNELELGSSAGLFVVALRGRRPSHRDDGDERGADAPNRGASHYQAAASAMRRPSSVPMTRRSPISCILRTLYPQRA